MAARATIRPKLLAISLAVAMVVGIGGGVLWARLSDDDDVDARLENLSSAGDELPDVDVLDGGGNVVSTGELVGTPLVVNLWYSTCAPCREEMPALAEVAAELDGEVRFVGINPLDDADTMLEFAQDVGVSYELYRDPDFAFVDAVRIVGFPTTFFVDAEGTIVAQTGEVDADDVRRHVEEIMP